MSAFRMRIRSRVGVAALGALFFAAANSAPARAQFFGYWSWGPPPPSQTHSLMPPGVIERHLGGRGFGMLGPLHRNGGVYLADVQDRFGHRRRLVIDAYSGAILQTFAYGPPRPPAGIPGYYTSRAYAPGYAEAPPAREPEVIPAPNEPRLAPAPRSHAKTAKRPSHKVARREVAPEKPAPHERAPSEATREPRVTAPANASTSNERSSGSGNAEKSAAHDTQASSAAAIRKAPPPPAKHPAPNRGATNKPGYANGVPINPLD